jgi:hypothetical protein
MTRKLAARMSDDDLRAYVDRLASVPAARKHYAAALAELIRREARS